MPSVPEPGQESEQACDVGGIVREPERRTDRADFVTRARRQSLGRESVAEFVEAARQSFRLGTECGFASSQRPASL